MKKVWNTLQTLCILYVTYIALYDDVTWARNLAICLIGAHGILNTIMILTGDRMKPCKLTQWVFTVVMFLCAAAGSYWLAAGALASVVAYAPKSTED